MPLVDTARERLRRRLDAAADDLTVAVAYIEDAGKCLRGGDGAGAAVKLTVAAKAVADALGRCVAFTTEAYS